MEGARGAFTFALGNAIWVLAAITAVCAILTWWLVPRKPTRRGEAEDSDEHRRHHRGRFHI